MALGNFISIWISGFIPRDMAGVTELITQGTHKGKTALRLPKSARAALMNLLKPLGTGYLTDQRYFSDKVTASARLQTIARFGLQPPGSMFVSHHTSGTTEINIDSGETQLQEDADLSDCTASGLYEASYGMAESILNNVVSGRSKPGELDDFTLALKGPIRSRAKRWTPSSGGIVRTEFGMMVNINGSASDPLVRLAANLEYDVTFIVGVNSSSETVIAGCFGFVDDFVDWECYALYGGHTKTLFRLRHPEGSTPFDLLGAPTRAVTGAAVFSPAASVARSVVLQKAVAGIPFTSE